MNLSDLAHIFAADLAAPKVDAFWRLGASFQALARRLVNCKFEVENMINGVFQNYPCRNAPFPFGRFQNEKFHCL